MARFWEKKVKKKTKYGWSGDKFYHTMLWRNLRNAYMKLHPLCLYCKFDHIYKAASVCDHIKPRRFGGSDTAEENLQPLCVSCHNRKSSYESRDKVCPYTEEIYKIQKLGDDAKDPISRQREISTAYEYASKTRLPDDGVA